MSRAPRAEPAREEADSKRPSHRVALGDDFHLWRSICLRGTGFPMAMLDGLVAPRTASAVDTLFAAEHALQTALTDANDWVYGRIKSSSDSERAAWRKAERLLRKGRAPETPSGEPEGDRLFEAVAGGIRDLERARDELAAGFDNERQEWGAYLAGLKQHPLFKEAVAWQNHQALEELSQAGEAHYTEGRRSRRESVFLASHLQRYCTKNESIGFFGPLGAADFVESGPAVALTPGPHLVNHRRVFFEYWCVYALAKSMESMPEMLPWLPPRLDPWLLCRDGWLVTPDGRRRRIPAPVERLLEACDGESTAKEIAGSLAAPDGATFGSPDAVFRTLEQLKEQKIIHWGFELPVTNTVERYMRDALERIEDDALRDKCLGQLDLLESKRRDVSAAAGRPDDLQAAMSELDQAFTGLTARSAARSSGRTYAGRTLVYEDCWRDVELRLGPDWLEQLKPPLSLVLASARWYAAEVSAGFQRHFEALFVRAERAREEVRLAEIWQGLAVASRKVVNDCAAELRRRWGEVLRLDTTRSEVSFDSEGLRPRVAAQFPVFAPTSVLARFHSPDLMIAAGGVEDINNGDFLFVLGEVHAHNNTLLQPVQLGPNLQADKLIGDFEADREGHPQLLLAINHDHGGTRVAPDFLTRHDLHVLRGSSPSWRPREQVYDMAELTLARSHQGLRVRAPGRSLDLPVSALFKNFLSVPTHFGLFSSEPHIPRVTIDKLVVHRRSWQFDLEDWQVKGDSQARYLHVCRLRARHGLPRRVFMRVPGEVKPQYVDFHSPISVLCMVRLINAAVGKKPYSEYKDTAGLKLSEMLPEPGQSWLTDASGGTYSCELRMAIMDDTTAKGFF